MVEEKNKEEIEESNKEQEAAVEKDTKVGEEEKSERSSLENLRVLENIDVKLTVEVGGAEIKLRDLLRINEGSVIELERLAGEFAAIEDIDKDSAANKLEGMMTAA